MLDSLKQIIEPQVVVRHSQNKIKLVEPNPDSRLREVNLHLTNWLKSDGGHLRNAIVVSGDNDQVENLDKFTFFIDASCEHITKKCDYIIFHAMPECIRVILCELKSSEQSVGEDARCHHQFRFSKVFASYLIDVAKEYASVAGSALNQRDVSFHKLVFVPAPNVTLPTTTGLSPTRADTINIRYNEQKRLNVVFLSTNSYASASLNWRELMAKLN
ncbi:TPA: hypothetical protein ACX6SK_001625 [Photobacterium damselae]